MSSHLLSCTRVLDNTEPYFLEITSRHLLINNTKNTSVPNTLITNELLNVTFGAFIIKHDNRKFISDASLRIQGFSNSRLKLFFTMMHFLSHNILVQIFGALVDQPSILLIFNSSSSIWEINEVEIHEIIMHFINLMSETDEVIIQTLLEDLRTFQEFWKIEWNFKSSQIFNNSLEYWITTHFWKSLSRSSYTLKKLLKSKHFQNEIYNDALCIAEMRRRVMGAINWDFKKMLTNFRKVNSKIKFIDFQINL